MRKYTQEELKKIPFYMKSSVTKEWIEESHLPKEYLGKLAILESGKKIGDSSWTFEGIDFEIITLKE